MNRIQIINNLIHKNGYKSYLEIGVRDGDCFRQINSNDKVGVDPDKASAATEFVTSDEYFDKSDKKFDIIFIDGLHHSDQVIKDIENSLNHLNEGGTITMHDCLPTNEFMQLIPLTTQNEWTGDVWKAYLKYRQERSDLSMYVINCDWGVGVITRGNQNPVQIDVDINYQNFEKFKLEWMNVISPDQFIQKYL